MSLTVRELVSRPELRLDVVVAGDLDRIIRWVHASDMPDPAPYLRGDEVVLTAGIWYWHGIAPGAFAASLGHSKVAALGFGTNPLVRAIPEELVEACQGWDLTLFRVPDDVSFIEIAEAFVEAEHRARERPLLESLERSSHFAYSLQMDGGLDGLLRVLAQALPRPAAVVQRGRGILAGTIGSLSSGLLRAVDEAIAERRVAAACDGHVAFAVPIASSDAALLIECEPEELSVPDRAVIDQALAFIAIELQRSRAVVESERRFVGELFDLVVAGEGQLPALTARLGSLGFAPGASLCALCCEAADPEDAMAVLAARLRDGGRHGVLAVKAGQLLGVLAVASDEDLPALAHELHEGVGAEAFLGMGAVTESPAGLSRSVIEATHACRFAARRRDAGYATHDTLASHALLIGLQDDRLLDAFRDTLIRPLDEHDSRRHTDLVQTLESFLGSGGRYQQTAEALHLHVNTLRLRLARIEQLTGRDLNSMDDRVDLWIALRARRP